MVAFQIVYRTPSQPAQPYGNLKLKLDSPVEKITHPLISLKVRAQKPHEHLEVFVVHAIYFSKRSTPWVRRDEHGPRISHCAASFDVWIVLRLLYLTQRGHSSTLFNFCRLAFERSALDVRERCMVVQMFGVESCAVAVR